jgi:predicted Rossmann fold nucleotide-binding protein DprA/Smf involved in DNA uptake
MKTKHCPKSGSLITANKTIEYGQKLFAIPRPIFNPTSKRPNHLIGSGQLFRHYQEKKWLILHKCAIITL